MASDTDSTTNDVEEADLRLSWSGRWTLAHRILAVNILTLVLLALSVLYLDQYRNRLSKERSRQTRIEATTTARSLALVPQKDWPILLAGVTKASGSRMRLYGPDGHLLVDSWRLTGPTYELRDPSTQKWTKDVARALDRGFNALVGAPPLDDFVEPEVDRAEAWPEALQAKRSGHAESLVRNAPDLTPVISAAAPIHGNVLLVTDNDRAFTRTVRSQRATLGAIMAAVIGLSLLLSIFLARTIVRPLRRLALAAHRVRLGRSREVRVPRLPSRTDEIGLLARAVSDMSQSLRQRIDNIEAFAADVTHELKNPLASLRSAVDSLERVDDPELRRQLLDVVRQDVARLDRLIGDIAEISRLDAELTRARFEPIDVGTMIEGLLPLWNTRAAAHDVRIAFARPRVGSAIIMGEEARLSRAIDNLVDNAISFSPP
ncbi:MAG TPA: stimulus-sensing domain-containing protein, partial [Sphingomicrobium sp.]